MLHVWSLKLLSASPLARIHHMVAIELQGRLGNAVFLYSQKKIMKEDLMSPIIGVQRGSQRFLERLYDRSTYLAGDVIDGHKRFFVYFHLPFNTPPPCLIYTSPRQKECPIHTKVKNSEARDGKRNEDAWILFSWLKEGEGWVYSKAFIHTFFLVLLHSLASLYRWHFWGHYQISSTFAVQYLA